MRNVRSGSGSGMSMGMDGLQGNALGYMGSLAVHAAALADNQKSKTRSFCIHSSWKTETANSKCSNLMRVFNIETSKLLE